MALISFRGTLKIRLALVLLSIKLCHVAKFRKSRFRDGEEGWLENYNGLSLLDRGRPCSCIIGIINNALRLLKEIKYKSKQILTTVSQYVSPSVTDHLTADQETRKPSCR